MSLDNTAVVPALPTGDYTIDQSLRFNDDDSAWLSRTPSSTTNQKTWTVSLWVKKTNNGTNYNIWGARDGSQGSTDGLIWHSSDVIQIVLQDGSGLNYRTTPIYRDPSAWYHIVWALDTTQSTTSDRYKLYVNGERITNWSYGTNQPSQNWTTRVNWSSATHWIGKNIHPDYPYPLDGYIAEVHFVDGQQLDPTYFGETGTYGEWKAKRYSGSYGTNGYYLDFGGTYYNDKSGNGNNWTANNLATTDVVLDSPTNNFCTINTINKTTNCIVSEGNTKVQLGGKGYTTGTFYVSSGKWYFEGIVSGTGNGEGFGIVSPQTDITSWPTNYQAIYMTIGYTRINNTDTSGYTTYTSGDVIGCALDMDNGTLKFYKNNSLVITVSSLPDECTPSYGDGSTDTDITAWFNFGQDSSFAGNKTAQGNQDENGYGDFYYTPPSGYLALCTANLSDPTVIPSENFNAVLYTGNGSSKSVTGVGFQPDLLITKRRDAASNFPIMDVLRGTSNAVFTNEGWAEETNYSHTLDTDGFTLGSEGDFNTSSGSYVAWNWKANGSGSSNTNGSLTVTTSANQDAGFSIVTYTGTGSATNYGHGLSQAPEMSFHFRRNSSTNNNYVWHKSLGAGGEIYLNSTGQGYPSYSSNLTPTLPTNTLFYIGPGGDQNLSGGNFVVYHFHSVDGFSKIGTYTGNADTTGSGAPFIYLGFKPKWWMHKRTDASGDGWWIYDGARNTYNPLSKLSIADRNNSEYSQSGSATPMDFVSNGVKIRNYSTDGSINGSGATYIYIAFAENPFKYTNGR